MSHVSVVYDNKCLNCGKRNTAWVHQAYCDSGCESAHTYKLERKCKKKQKIKSILDRLESIEDRMGSIEDRMGSIEDRMGLIENDIHDININMR